MVTSHDPRAPAPAEVRRLRNAALIALAGNDNLTPSVLVRLRGDSVRVRAGQSLRLVVRRAGGHLVVYLNQGQATALSRYLDLSGLWHAPRALFEGLGLAGIKQVLWRARRRSP